MVPRLVVCLAALVVLGVIASTTAVQVSGAYPPTQVWTVTSNGIALDVPASWPVFTYPDMPCPRPGGTVWIDQRPGQPAPICPAFSSNTKATMVVVGKLVATNSVVGRATTINGLLAEVRISSPWGQVLTADFPIQNAEVQITSFGNTSTAAQRASVLHNALQLLHSVLATSIVYTGMPQPAGPPMALRVTAVGPGLGPYNPMQGNQGIPIEVVRYHLAQVPTTSYVCQTVVRQQGKVVGYAASDHGAHGPGSPPVPPGYSPQNPAEAVQLSGPTFKGVPADATVTCRPEQAQAP